MVHLRNLHKYLPFVIFCFSIGITFGQSSKKDRVLANQYLRDARIFRGDAAYDQSNQLLRSAMQMYAKMGMWVKYCSTKKLLINNFETTEQWDSVRILQEGLLKESVKHLGKNNRFEKQGYVTLGEAYIHRNQPDYAIPFLEEGLSMIDGKAIGREEEKTKLYTLLGMAYELRAEHKIAIDYFEKAREYVENSKVFELSIIAQWNYAYSKALFREKKLAQSLVYAEKSLSSNQALYSPNSRKSAESLLLLADIQGALGNFKASILNIDKAIKVLSGSLKNHPLLVEAYREKGAVLSLAGKAVEAKKTLEKGIESALKIFGKKHPETASCYLVMAELSLRNDNLDYGLSCIEKGILALLPFQDKIDIDFKYEPILSSTTMLQLLLVRQQLYKAAYIKQAKATALDNIIATALKGEQLRIQIQAEYFNLYERTLLTKNYQLLYNEAIAAHIKLAESKKNAPDPSHYQQALIWAERIKQFQKRNLLYINTVRMMGGLSEQMKETEIRHLKGLTQLKLELSKAVKLAPENLSQLKNNWSAHWKTYNNWLLELKKIKPAYYNCFYAIPDLSLGDVQAKLIAGHQFLMFIEGDAVFYRFWMNEKELSVKELNKNPKHEASLLWIASYLKDSEAAKDADQLMEFGTASSQLYNWLLSDILAPTDSSVHHLHIIADGSLQQLPFELLLSNAPQGKAMQWPYLIRRMNIGYFWTVGDMLRSAKHPASKGLLLANTNYSNLPAIREMRDLYRVAQDWSLGGTGNKYRRRFKGKFQLNLEATERTLTQTEFEGFAAFQPAFYADFSEQNPMLSRLLLSYEKDSLFDGAWYAYEISNLSIPIPLLVLNGVGDSLLLNDSKKALLLAFDYSGVEATLWPLWRQNEADERKIIQIYYEKLTEGLSKTEALRQTKIQFLEANDGLKAAPHYWAAFKLNGIDGLVNIEMRNRFPWIPVSVGGIFLLGILTLLWRRQRAKKVKRLLSDN